MCDFTASDELTDYEFEFVGPGDIWIQVNLPRSFRLSQYRVLDFSYTDRRIHVVHTGSGESGVMPSFTLKGVGDNVLLTIEGKEIRGMFFCQWQLDDPS